MAARDNNQPRGGGTILPGFGELVQNLEAAQTRLPRIDFASTSSWAHTGARPHSGGATSPYNYTHSQPGRPSWETRDRLEDWRREQGHSVPRRYPTPPRDAPPPTITSAFEAQRQPHNDTSDIYDNHRGNSGRQGSYDHGPYNHPRSSISGHNQGSLPSPRYSQPAAGYRPRSRESGYSSQEVMYSPQAYGGGGHHHSGFSSTASPSGGGYHHSPSSYHSAAPPSSSGGEHQRGRKRSTAHEEAEDAGRKRRNFPQPIINILKKWAVKRIDDLKFSQEEKDEIVRETGLDRNQVTGWYINYHRRGWAQDRWDHYKNRLSDAEAAFHAVVAEARRASDMGGEGGGEEAAVRRAADAEAARLDALVEELGAKERLARKELEEHKSKKRGGC